MTWLAAILIRRGISTRLASLLAWTAMGLAGFVLVFAAVLAIRHLINAGKQEAIVNHDKDVTIEAANRVIAAERAATANQTANASVFANSQQELHDVVREKGTAAPTGPAVSGVLARMRQQQAAGRR